MDSTAFLQVEPPCDLESELCTGLGTHMQMAKGFALWTHSCCLFSICSSLLL